MRNALLVLASLLAGCGGSTVTIPDGTQDSGSPSGDSGARDGTTGADGASDGASGDAGCTGSIACLCGTPYCDNGAWKCTSCNETCPQMLAELDTMRAQLRSCNPNAKSLQCQNKAQDVCCAITVNVTDVSAFEALVSKYKQACHPLCPAILCPVAPSQICDPLQSNPQSGSCR